MLQGLLGTKVGMAQVFTEDRLAVPVTVVNIGGWFITQIKTKENDGYSALQVGLVRNRYRGKEFSAAWLKTKKTIFRYLQEIAIDEADEGKYVVGKSVALDGSSLEEKSIVHVTGISIGRGFQGVMKRWGFAGGPGGHGSTFHRSPGAIGTICSQGIVFKGKKLPGHYGNKKITVQGLKVVRIDKDAGYLFLKGAVPGKKNSLLFMRKKVTL